MYLLKFLKESQNTNIKTKDLRNKSSKKKTHILDKEP